MLLALFIVLQILLVVVFAAAFIKNSPVFFTISLVLAAVLMFSAYGITENYTYVNASNTTVTGSEYYTTYTYGVGEHINEQPPLFYLNFIVAILSLVLSIASWFGVWRKNTGREF